ncbi:gliding motility-associated C-terminal domain-containing protein [Spirosomataceae bacterium TFI 002]|nr:gliding motility-associated C-terminal domain-containing protein [Spirosomataceae bacterium TFI 002]
MKGVLLGLFLGLSQFLMASEPSSGFTFIENLGQWHEDILFKSDIPGGVLLVTKRGLEYQFYEKLSHPYQSNSQARVALRSDRVTVNVLEGNFHKSLKSQAVQGTYNYFIGKDPSKWKSNVKAYRDLLFGDVLENIDFRIYSLGESIKYEFIVRKGGNPSDIKLVYDDKHHPKFNNNGLEVSTILGLIKEFPPYSFQDSNGSKQKVGSGFRVDKNVVSFKLATYDKSKDLIIDPELVFSTYSGGVSDNWAQTATYDDDGNLYAGGTVFGPSFPISSAGYQQAAAGASSNTFEGSITDIVIQKYSKDGKSLLYSTFLGGEASEVSHSLVVNSRGELVVFGTTSSPNFPVTPRAYDASFAGGPRLIGAPITTSINYLNGTDIFVTVLGPNGDKLVGSTFLGGSNNDGIHNNGALKIKNYGDEFRGEVYVDNEDKIYLATTSLSGDFPIVNGEKLNRSNDALVCRLNRDLSRLEWSSFLGGEFYDAAYGIRVNEKKEVFVVGSTISKDIGATNGTYQSSLAGEMDGFVAKYVADKLVALTYIGTKEEDLGMFLDLDNEGQVYVFGLTEGQYAVSPGVYRNANSGQFVHCLSNDLKKSVFSTVFGSGRGVGIIDIVPTAFLVNKCGNIYLAGWGGKVNANNGFNENSTTLGLPTSQDAYQKETTGSNFYFAILEAGARSLLYGTFFGSSDPPDPNLGRGDHLDGGTCRFDKNGVIYHTACVCRAQDGIGSVQFPLKNAYETKHGNSNCNLAAFKFDISALKADFNILDGDKVNPEIVCNTTKLDFKNKSTGALTYEWAIDDTAATRLESFDYTFLKEGTYEIKLSAYNKLNCSASDSITRTIKVIPFPTKISNDTVLCPGGTVNLFASGGDTYSWLPANLVSNSTSAAVTAEPLESTEFEVTISNAICSTKRKIKAEVTNDKPDFYTTLDLEICKGDEIKLEAFGAGEEFTWTGEDLEKTIGDNIIVAPLKSSTYRVQTFYEDGCKPFKDIHVTIDESFGPVFSSNIIYNCGKPFELEFDLESNDKVVSYVWQMGNGDSLVGVVPNNYKYRDAGTYNVRVDAKNKIGCILSSELALNIPDGDGIIPNAISPNGDGKNDTFVIGVGEATLRIYNRWGKLLYENMNYKNDWGGNVKPDVYFYEIILNNAKTCKGWVEVFN